jgi:hypothetical protein
MSWIGLLPWFSAAGTTDTAGRASRAGNQKVQRLASLRRRGWLHAALAAACTLLLGWAAAPAAADLPSGFGSRGSGAGQLDRPSSVAVSQASGDVYVLDVENNRVDEFTGVGKFERAWGWDVDAPPNNKEELQECTTVTGCQAGSAGSGAGQLDQPASLGGIAVDNCTNALTKDPCTTLEDPAVGDVYVLNGSGGLDQFDSEGDLVREWPVNGGSVAVGPTGMVYVGENGAVQEYDPETGAPVPGGQITLEGAGGISDLAIDAQSEIYVTEGSNSEASGETHPVRHYDAAGAPVGELPECAAVPADGNVPGAFDCEEHGSARAVAVNAAGEVFVNQRPASAAEQIRGFSPGGVLVAAFAPGSAADRLGLAFGEQTGALYVSLFIGETVEVLVPPPPGPIVSKESVSGIEPASAVVHAVINPNAPAFCGETHYLVQYGLTAGYGKTAPVSEGALSRSFDEDPVEVPLGGLSTRTTYHYRFVASDECEETPGVETAHTTDGEDATFTTEPPALIEEQWSTAVRSTSVTLHATIDPFGFATEFRFQYLTQAEFEADGNSFPDDATSTAAAQLGSTKTEVQQHVQGLTAGQEYHYRVVAANTIAGKEEVEAGEPLTFTTQTGGEAGLPDGRQWELVSPPDKHGARVEGIGSITFVQAAADGGALVYPASGPTESEPRGHAEHTQVISKRTSTGWENHDLLAPHTSPVGAYPDEAYSVFSSDLSAGALITQGGFEPALSSEATEQTPYLFDSASRTYTPLVTRANDTTEPFVPFGGEAEGECHVSGFCPPWVQGASPDLRHIILGAGVGFSVGPLLKGANGNGGELYEWSAGKLSLVSVLPSGAPAGGANLGGGQVAFELVAHAVSEDGSRVFWQAPYGIGFRSFMRDMTREETIELPDGFEGANANGTLVFGGGKECEVIESVPVLPDGEHMECAPVDEQGTTTPLEDGRTLAASEDGSIVYFQRGEDFYVRRGNGAAKLIASNVGTTQGENGAFVPQADPWRASPNGEWFAFMSDSPLTGYDNRDALTGARDEEVYLYSAAAERLVCASCDPTGERPHGTAAVNLRLASYGGIMNTGTGLQSVAATIPGWAPYLLNRAVYDPRVVSNSGRLFFNATDGLVPKDVNGQVDVYELEQPAGAPGGSESGDNCTTATRTGSQLYVPSEDGCLALISNGESDEESAFEDASETGEDVFFLSASKLTTADLDGSLAMWDAQVCTTTNPCPPAPATAPTPCSTEASCKASPTPPPTLDHAPAAATFNGPGNVAPEPTKPAVKKVTKKTTKCKAGFVRKTVKSKRGKAKSECVRKAKPKKRGKH